MELRKEKLNSFESEKLNSFESEKRIESKGGKVKKSYELDMTTGAILPKMLQFCFPLIFTGVLQLLFNAADVFVVGKYVGAVAMASVGTS